MAGFSDIIGHEQIIGHLKNAIALDKVSHAYIFNGPKLSGKMMLAEAFAMALQCEGEGTRPCLLCRSCKQARYHLCIPRKAEYHRGGRYPYPDQ